MIIPIQDEVLPEENYVVLSCQEDFEEFWLEGVSRTAKALPDEIIWKMEPHSFPVPQVRVFRVTLTMVDQTCLQGWYVCPIHASLSSTVPALVRFHGYGSDKGTISHLLIWGLLGYAVLSMDVRGQSPESPDGRAHAAGSHGGWMTQGLAGPETYYYREVYLDAVAAVELLARRPEIRAQKIGLFGDSQGAAIASAATALVAHYGPRFQFQSYIAALSAALPFLSNFAQGLKMDHRESPLAELDVHMAERKEEVLRVLSYFDIMNFAPWIQCPTLVALALKDQVCPRETVLPFYNNLGMEDKLMALYPDHGHEPIDAHMDRRVMFFAQWLMAIS